MAVVETLSVFEFSGPGTCPVCKLVVGADQKHTRMKDDHFCAECNPGKVAVAAVAFVATMAETGIAAV